MPIAKITIKADAVLTEVISDYLVGVLAAAVEYSSDDEQAVHEIHAFVMSEGDQGSALTPLTARIGRFVEEMAILFKVEKPLISSEMMVDQDWSAQWKAHFKPFAILDRLVIAPSWEPYHPAGDERVIVMDPGMAFGTGHHATTRLCLKLMESEKSLLAGGTMLDVGTGTGILSMAAALFGAASVLGIDNDEAAVEAARRNVTGNGLDRTVQISAIPLETLETCYSIVVANIVHDTLLELADDLGSAVKPAGTLILSGVLNGEQSTAVRSCFEMRGFRLLEEVQEGEWSAVMLQKKREV